MSVAEEAAACRKAFKGFRVGGFVLHCHHEIVGEILTVDAENRIAYILSYKPKHEQALRLRLFRPVPKNMAGAIAPARKTYDEAIAPARKAYDEAIATASKAYDEAIATASKAFTEAIAPARKDYNEAGATARKKAYDEAIAPARKAYDEAIAPAHAKLCKNCPWDGETIFPSGAT